MRDAIDFETMGLPSAVVIADALYGPADAMRRLSGLPDYPLPATQFPVGSLDSTELAERAAQLAPAVVRALTERPALQRELAASAGTSDSFVFDDDESALGWLFDNGFTDGLPVVVPTPERVAALLSQVDSSPSEPVIMLPTRAGLTATVETVAVNAVMAGVTPPLFPVVLAAARAAGDPASNLHAHTGTMAGAQQVIVINGPQRSRLGFRSEDGALGPGWRANATVGRALRLVIRNALGSVHGQFDRAGFSHPGRYTWCIAEHEERSPWPPFAAQLGAAATGVDAVSLFATVWQASIINHEPRALPIIDDLALVARTGAHANWLHHDVASDSSFYAKRPFVFVTGHEHARVLARDGFGDLDRLREALYNRMTGHHSQLRPVAIADPSNIYFVYVHATGMQQSQFFAPFQSHHAVTRVV